jgi:hypothetical protein
MRIKEIRVRRRIVGLVEEIARRRLELTARLFLASHPMLRPPLRIRFRGAAEA